MKIKFRIAANEETEINVTSLVVEGIPYVPPAPEPVQRWTLEVALNANESGYVWPSHAYLLGTQSAERARFLAGFDAQGRVWFADKKARELADFLLSLIKIRYAGTSFERVLREAAERLAGPEPDAT